MYKRYYDGYNSYSGKNTTSYRGEVVIPKEIEVRGDEDIEKDTEVKGSEVAGESSVASFSKSSPLNGFSKLFENIEIDDVILLGIILLVLKDSADDPLLIIILLVVFFSGLTDN